MRRYALVFAVAASFSCGGGSPTDPGTNTPPPVTGGGATPTPAARPTPNLCSTCEAPVTNSNPPARIEIRMYQVRKPNGDAAPCLNEDAVAPGNPIGEANTRYWFAPIPVGYTLKLDATAFDRFNKPTNSDCIKPNGEENRACITWRFGHGEHLIDSYSLGHIFQPTFRVTGEGDFQIQAEMYDNGSRVRSPWYWMNFTADASQSPCSR